MNKEMKKTIKGIKDMINKELYEEKYEYNFSIRGDKMINLKQKYNDYRANKQAEKERLDVVRAEVKVKETERRLLQKEEAIRNRPEMMRQRREAFRGKVSSTVSSLGAKAKEAMNKPRPKTKTKSAQRGFASVGNDMMSSLGSGGGNQFGNPLKEFDTKKKKGNPYGNPLKEFDRKKKIKNSGFGWM